MGKFRGAFWGSLVFIFLVIFVGSSPASADERGDAVGRGSFEHARYRHWGVGFEAPWISIILRHRSQLGLTAEQVATLERLRSDFGQQTAPQREKLRNAEMEIRRLLRDSPVDLDQVKAKIDEAEKLRAEFRYLRIETLEKGKSVLTEQQRDELRNLISSRRDRFRRRRGEPS